MGWLRFLLVGGKIEVLFEVWIYLTSVRKDFLSTDADGTRGATSVFLHHKTWNIGCSNSVSFCLLDRCCLHVCLGISLENSSIFFLSVLFDHLYSACAVCVHVLDLLVCVLSVFVSVPRYIYHSCVRAIFTRDPISSKETVACAVRICLSVIEVIDCGPRCSVESAKRALHWQMPFHSPLCTYSCYSGSADKHIATLEHTRPSKLSYCLLSRQLPSDWFEMFS